VRPRCSVPTSGRQLETDPSLFGPSSLASSSLLLGRPADRVECSWSRSSTSCFVRVTLRRGTSWRWRDGAATARHDEPRSGGPSAWRRSSRSAATMTASRSTPTRDGRARIGFSPPLADLGYQPGDMALLPPARPGSGVVARRTSAARGGRRVPGTDSDDRRPCADPRVPRGERALRILGTGVGRPTRRNGLLRQLLTAQHGPCAGDDRTKHPSKRRCGRFPARRCCHGSALVRIQFAVDTMPFRKEGGPKPLQPCRPWVERRQHTASEEP
jgi:hypothetical protein